jgi:hypothetical protein
MLGFSPMGAAPMGDDGQTSDGGSVLWTPTDAATPPRLWLQGDLLTGTNGDPISLWDDSSASNNDGTAAGSTRPTLATAALNSLNVARFSAAALQYMDVPTSLLTGDTAGSGFSVTKLNADPSPSYPFSGPVFGDWGTASTGDHYPDPGDSSVYIDFLSTTRKNTGNPAPSLAAWHIAGFQSGASDWRAYFNGTLHFSTTTNTVATGSVPIIGRSTGGGSFFLNGDIAEVIYYDSFLSQSDREKVEGYLAHKWAQTALLDSGHPYKTNPPMTGGASHAATGALTGQSSSIAGSAARIAIHAATGALAGQGSVIAGSAARAGSAISHAASGVLTGQGAAVTGTAARVTNHASAGALIGQGATLAGVAARARLHASAGVLSGAGASLLGSATRTRQHTSTGTLTAQGAIITGISLRYRIHAAAGGLTGQGSTVSGNAARGFVAQTHVATGSLQGQGSAITGLFGRNVIISGDWSETQSTTAGDWSESRTTTSGGYGQGITT